MTTLFELGSAIRAERKRRKMTQQQLAADSGVHRNTVAGLEAGRSNVELSTFMAVCARLELVLRVVPKAKVADNLTLLQDAARAGLDVNFMTGDVRLPEGQQR